MVWLNCCWSHGWAITHLRILFCKEICKHALQVQSWASIHWEDTSLIGIDIPIIDLRWSSNLLRFIMGIPIPVRLFLANTGPGLANIFLLKMVTSFLCGLEVTMKIYEKIRFFNGDVVQNNTCQAWITLDNFKLPPMNLINPSIADDIYVTHPSHHQTR